MQILAFLSPEESSHYFLWKIWVFLVFPGRLTQIFHLPYGIYAFCIVFQFHAECTLPKVFMFFIQIFTFEALKIFLSIYRYGYHSGILNVFYAKIAKFSWQSSFPRIREMCQIGAKFHFQLSLQKERL